MTPPSLSDLAAVVEGYLSGGKSLDDLRSDLRGFHGVTDGRLAELVWSVRDAITHAVNWQSGEGLVKKWLAEDLAEMRA